MPVALVAASLLAPASAVANHSLKELLSTGPAGGNAAGENATFQAASDDGGKVFFTTDEALVSADQDTAVDVYERSNGATALVSVGDQPGPSDASFTKASPDGTHVLFETADQLLPADTDSSDDLYERSGGTTTLFPSAAAAATSSASDYTDPPGAIGDYSQDGAKLFFTTTKQLDPEDADSGTDVYQRSSSGLSLLSTGPNGGNGPNSNAYAGATPDGSHVFFHSNEALVSGDGDSVTDVYERSNGTTTLVSTGPDGGNGPQIAVFRGATPDGVRVFFVTSESLMSSDADGGAQDVYSRTGSATTLDSGGNGLFNADFSAVSNDGARVFFRTAEQLVGADTDSAVDVYERFGAVKTLISTGSSPCSGSCSHATFGGLTPDGSRVWFETAEPLESADGDTKVDVYMRSGSSTTLVSTGAGVPCCADLSFRGASQDGTRAFFGTATWDGAKWVQSSSSSSFERFGSGTTPIVSSGVFNDLSLDATRVFVQTSQSLVSNDTDGAQDVYSLSVVPYDVPKAATPVNVSLVPVFRQCGPGNPPNGEHAAPLSGGACLSPATTGTAHFGTQASASARISVTPGDPATGANEADVSFLGNLTDVRGGSPTGADYNPNPTGPDASLVARWRITDSANGPNETEAGTATEIDFSVPVDCVSTSDPSQGAGCGVLTSANGVQPGSINESKGMVVQLFRVRVTDSGLNGTRGDGDDTLFAQQGFYVP